MSIDQAKVVDVISTDPVNGAVTLTMTDHLEWGSGEHLLSTSQNIEHFLLRWTLRRTHMTSRGKFAVAVFALLVPVALVVGRDVFSSRSLLADPTTAGLNWLFMAAPQLVVLAVAAVSARSRQRFLPLALLLSAFVVVLFQAWIWFFVPPREGALAWILYIPLWLVVLAVLAGVLAWRTGGAMSSNLAVQRTAPPPADL